MAAVAGQLGAFGANGASRLASVVFRELVPTAFTAVSSACLGASTTSTSFARTSGCTYAEHAPERSWLTAHACSHRAVDASDASATPISERED